jgi:hypothetical protein
VAAYQPVADRPVLTAVLVGIGVWIVLGAALAVLLGSTGVSPGLAATGLRVVRVDDGAPIGVGPALLRQAVLGVAGLPTFGIGLAALAWTAVMDPRGNRRGWHDQQTDSVVLDVRPVAEDESEVESGPRHVVNLTAMRLVPAAATPPVSAPARSPRPPTTPPPTSPPPTTPPPTSPPPVPAPPATPDPAATGRHAAPPAQPASRQQLGYPLVPEPSSEEPPRVGAQHSTAERTVMRAGSAGGALTRWRVAFDSGETFVVEGLALVGRRPEPRAGEPVRHVVPLRSEDLSLSKTHAQFQVAADGVLVVMDRGSTNGSILVRQGVPRELPAGKPATLVDGDVVRFGDREMTVQREE